MSYWTSPPGIKITDGSCGRAAKVIRYLTVGGKERVRRQRSARGAEVWWLAEDVSGESIDTCDRAWGEDYDSTTKCTEVQRHLNLRWLAVHVQSEEKS
jgi:hypothetical protein